MSSKMFVFSTTHAEPSTISVFVSQGGFVFVLYLFLYLYIFVSQGGFHKSDEDSEIVVIW